MESKPDLSNISTQNIKCQICEKIFDSTEELDVHTDVYQGSLSHKCPDCTMSFKCRYDTKRHMVARHERELGDNENTYYIRCPKCVMTFKSCDGITRHTKAAHELDINDEDDIHATVPKALYQRLHDDENPQNLSYVGKVKSNGGLQSGLNHKCPDCAMTFECRDETNRHVVERHDRELKLSENTQHLKCPKCVMTFKSCDNVNRHAKAGHDVELGGEDHVNVLVPKATHQTWHGDENEEEQSKFCQTANPQVSQKYKNIGNFKCHICEKILRTAKGLRVHVDRHQGILGHNCPKCDMTLKCKCRYDTNRHKVIRHKRELGANENTKKVESFTFVDANDEDDGSPRKFLMKVKKPKAPATHPPYIDMVSAALQALQEPNGTSRQALLR